MAKVSIVAPVYNVAPYLSNFIESVIGQTFPDWELLLVDDGSTDSGGQICDDYALKDARIRVFHKQNCGVSSARNVGLRNMQGEWVLMPDPDDELTLDCLETLMCNVSDEIDLISFSYLWYKNGVLSVPIKQSLDMDMSRNEFVSWIGIIPQPRNLDRRCCNKLFRASVIKDNEVYFPEDLHFREDVLYNYQFLEKSSQKVRCLSCDLYNYYMRNTGAALSLQENYTPKSGGKFIAMTRCYDILDRMGGSENTKNGMKQEILSAYIAVRKLLHKNGGREGKGDKRVYFNKLSQYYSVWELCLVGIKACCRRLKKA